MKTKEKNNINPDVLEMIQSDPKLASLPEVYYSFKEAVGNPNVVFEEVGNIVLKDVHLTARLLKIVNSSFYNFPNKVETITHASSVIGTEQLSYLILSTVVMDKFRGISEDIISMNSFWKHSIACGLIAKKLAEYKGEPNSEKHFIAALLHDIGRLVMCTMIPNRNWEVLVRSNLDNKAIHLVEAEELGFDHAEVGGTLLQEWNLPQVYQEVARYHHNPIKAPRYSYEASLCHLADIIANTLKLGCSGESYVVPELDEQAWARIQLSPKINLSVIKDEVEEVFDETVQAFLQN